MTIKFTSLLAVMLTCAACAPETASDAGSVTTPTASATGHAGAAASSVPLAPTAPSTPPPVTPAPSAAPQTPTPERPATPPPVTPAAMTAPAPMVTPPPAMQLPPAPPVTPPPMTTPAAPMSGSGSGGGTPADKFCDKYGEHCGYNMMNRHKDRAACMADFNATPAQQGCKNMHIDTAIAGTAAACNGMPSAFCFSIHCLHAAGIVDQTGVTYCK